MRDYTKPLMSERPIQKVYYTTPEIAAIVFESASCIRFWAKYFDVRAKIVRTSKKLYTKSAVAKFHMIKILIRTEKYTAEGAKQKLQSILLA